MLCILNFPHRITEGRPSRSEVQKFGCAVAAEVLDSHGCVIRLCGGSGPLACVTCAICIACVKNMTYVTFALKKNAYFDSGCTHELNPGGEFLTLTSQAAPDSGPGLTLLYSLFWNPEFLHLYGLCRVTVSRRAIRRPHI